MVDLSVNFMGFKLKNPVVVAASGLTGSADGVRKAVEAGAGAVVLKSLFEEQILAELDKEEAGIDLDAYPEAEAFISRTAWEEGTEHYLQLVKDSKAAAGGTPIFASINCIGSGNWASFAASIEEAGADGLELNIAYLPFTSAMPSKDLEDKVLATVREVRAVTKLPLSVKLGQYYTSLPHLAKALSKEGTNALVLFNRFYRFDIDLKSMKLTSAQAMSSPEEYHESLRWISLLFQKAGVDLAAATGIHTAETALKCILAGAGAVQVCSMIYKGGWRSIGGLIDDLSLKVEALGFSSVDSMRGRLSAHNADKPEEYMRLQYIKALTGIA